MSQHRLLRSFRSALRIRAFAVAAALLPAVGARAQSTVLDFFDTGSPGLEAFVEDQAGYGDNAPNTPDITAEFDGLQIWDAGYGDLLNVAYVDSGAGVSRAPFGSASITLTAAAGSLVRLDSVDLAGFGGTLDFDSITVTGGNVPFSQNNVLVPGTDHNTLDFGGITGQTLVVTFNDADTQESAGIDNFRFGQVVPEPACLPLLCAAAALTVARRRRLLAIKAQIQRSLPERRSS